MSDLKWSYSSLGLFQQCPRKYYHLRVAKDIKEPETEAILYGKLVHEAAEFYIGKGTPLPPPFEQFKEVLDMLKNIPGEKLCEYKMGLKKEDGRLVACDFFAKDVWYRGVADLVILNNDKQEARVIDYKTGKSAKYADTKQWALMAACIFVHFPQIKTVKAGLLFVVAEDFIKADYDAGTGLNIFSELDETLASRETAYEYMVFNPKQNFTCKAWCPVIICPHNGRMQ